MKPNRSLGMLGLGLFLLVYAIRELFDLDWLVLHIAEVLLALVSGILILMER